MTQKFEEPAIKLGLRVLDVAAAAEFYAGLGFDPVATVPTPEGGVAMAILRRGDLLLLVDSLHDMPFPDSARERRTKEGPRGLGIVIGVKVSDVDAAAAYFARAGGAVTSEPADAPWGERFCEGVDPEGYAWKFFAPLAAAPADSTGAAYQSWFGDGGGDA